MAERVYDMCEPGIKNSIIVNLTSAIEKANKTFQDKEEISIHFICKNLLSFIGSMDLDSLTLSFSDELKKAHQSIQSKIDSGSRTYKNN
jgi:methionine synthase II (cobalamin-independent)